MKDGKLRDALIVLAAVVPLGAAFGALLGWSANEFGVSSGVRVVLMFGFVALIGRLSAMFLTRRAKLRTEARTSP